jgi:membrane associated rhomboid family serine protease
VDSSEVIIRVAHDPRQAESWSFVLEALGISHRVLDSAMGPAIAVESAVARRAADALAAHDQEAAEAAQPEPVAPDSGPSSIGVVVAMGLVAFFFLTGPRSGTRWFAAGTAVADLIVRGEWWRAVTALTLHADLGHVAGNAAALIIFVSALGRWLGPGLAALLVLFTGFAGNLATAHAHGSAHNSVGASTATFGALGLLGGLQFMRRFRWKARLGRRRWALAAIAACLGMLVMIGGGGADLPGAGLRMPRNIDVLAHVTGLGAGLGAGLLVGGWLRRPLPAWAQGLLLLLSAAILTGAWWRALMI